VHFATNGSIPVKAYKNGAYNMGGMMLFQISMKLL